MKDLFTHRRKEKMGKSEVCYLVVTKRLADLKN